jgi:hypothetical protein
MKDWLKTQANDGPRETVEELLKKNPSPSAPQLELRAGGLKPQSRDRHPAGVVGPDDRIRGLSSIMGGKYWTLGGEGFQPQNLKRSDR